MKHTLEVLLAGVVDYAGLFPPAALDMALATANYARYLDDPDRRILARFVVPVLRLREFEEATADLLPREGTTAQPWRLSALAGPDLAADIDLVLKFNARHAARSGSASSVIDTLEIKASTTDEILAGCSIVPPQLTPFFEIPITHDPVALIAAIGRGGARAKLRTGGVTPDAFPDPRDVARFMIRCRDARVAFKLTAGLHHPIRAEHNLTYAVDSPRGVMFGYLNMFVAAALAWDGGDETIVLSALLATTAGDFQFSDRALAFAGHTVAAGTISDARANFIISFGSCSFREPVDDLAAISAALSIH